MYTSKTNCSTVAQRYMRKQIMALRLSKIIVTIIKYHTKTKNHCISQFIVHT